MKKIATLAATLLAVGASTAMAQGFNLSWGNCGNAGTSTMAINCSSNAGALLVANASVYPYWPMPTFAAASSIIDIRVGGGGVLPPWWQTNAGQCRANSIGMSFDSINNATDCPDIWAGNPNLWVSAIQQGVHGPNYVRLNGIAAFPAGSEIPIGTGTELWVCRVSINMANTTTCAGCSQPAVLVLNEVKLYDPNLTYQLKMVTNPADNACIVLNGGQSLCAGGATPAQNRTWGAVKNLYR